MDVSRRAVRPVARRFDEAQLVELVNEIAVENYRARFDWAFGIGSQGFTEGAFCVRPEGPPQAVRRGGPRRRRPDPGTAPPGPSGRGPTVRPVPIPLGLCECRRYQQRRSPGPRRDRGSRRDRGAGRARLARSPGALRRLHRHVLARQRQVGWLRGGLRLLRAVALRRGGHADARDDDPGADPRARPRRRGGGRPPLLHGHAGPGPLQARLRERARGCQAGGGAHEPQALRVDRAHVERSRPRAQGRRIQRVHHNVETAESYYPEVSSTVRYEGRIRTIDAVKDAGLETCVGGILNLGESREQRVEMAFQLAELEPTSVPINLLNPRAGHQVRRPRADGSDGGRQVGGDLPPDDPRRALPALRRPEREPGQRAAAACRQGGPERRDDGQLPHHARLRARGGPRGVRGARPERGEAGGQRREPAAGQPLRLARGREPATPIDELVDSQEEANFWDPATQLRHRARSVGAATAGRGGQPRPGPDEQPARSRRLEGSRPPHERHRGAARGAARPRALPAHEGGLRAAGAAGPAGRQAVLLLCSNNYLGLADHPRVREAAAEAAMR